MTDDDVDKRLLMVMALSKHFPTASVFECFSGKEALEYFFANHVDVLVTNHNMKPIDGLQLVTEIRKRGSDVPIIMVSGHEEMRAKASLASGRRYSDRFYGITPGVNLLLGLAKGS